jgi:copper(I)-binding protein
MNSFKTLFCGALMTLMLSSAAWAQPNLNDLSFSDPWIRGSAPGQKNGAGYLVIENASSQPGALVSAQSNRAARIELHTIVRENNVARMQEVEQIDIPANGSVTLQPGGFHVMFIGLTQPFAVGESIAVQLNFSDGQSTQVMFEVKPPTHMGGTSHGGQAMPHSH